MINLTFADASLTCPNKMVHQLSSSLTVMVAVMSRSERSVGQAITAARRFLGLVVYSRASHAVLHAGDILAARLQAIEYVWLKTPASKPTFVIETLNGLRHVLWPQPHNQRITQE